MIHQLKTWPIPFKAVVDGKKRFEYRQDDRGFKVGHFLRLQEYDPATLRYTGRTTLMRVTYILKSGFGIPTGFCIMSIEEHKY